MTMTNSQQVPCTSSYGPYFDAMLEAKDSNGWTPLMVACAKGMCDAAQLLIDQGVRECISDSCIESRVP